jgi:hypothetical protein
MRVARRSYAMSVGSDRKVARRSPLRDLEERIKADIDAFRKKYEFFENVPLHLYEKRELASGEKEADLVLRFRPDTSAAMLVACLWDHWQKPGERPTEGCIKVHGAW